MSDIHDLMNEIAAFTEERDWDQFHSPENLAKSISIEAPRFVFSNKYIPQGLRGSDKGIYLEALEHCIHLDNPFGDVNCGEGCPLWKNCMGTEPDVILLPLKEIIENLDMPADRQAKILVGITRCCDEMQDGCQNECPYGKECEGEDVTLLIRGDVYMNHRQQTLDYYNHDPAAFVSGTLSADMMDTRSRFAICLPPHGLVLDFGCGSGRDTKAFLEAGYQVEATDGSEELCALASGYTGIPVRRMLFSELDAVERYDGIWACASILHLPKDELAEVLGKVRTALKSDGVLYTSFKYGDYEGMRNGRYFTCFTEETLDAFWKNAEGLRIFDRWVTEDARPDRKDEKWINLLARRV